jgi:EpsI family protein
VDKQRVRIIVLVVIFLLTFGGVWTVTNYRLRQHRSPNWSLVPYEVGEWRGTDGRFDPIYGDDPADSSLLRIYRKVDGPPVIAYVGFFGDLASILDVHTPELCYPAQGWGVRAAENSGKNTFRGLHIPLKQIIVEKNGDRRLVIWWYNAGSRPFQTRIRYVYAMLLMSAFTGRTDGSMVRLETPLEREPETAAVARIEEFQSMFLPVLEQSLPH